MSSKKCKKRKTNNRSNSGNEDRVVFHQKSHNFCKHCLQLDANSEEVIVLTDNRLLSLYESVTDCPAGERPQHRVNRFVVHDSDRRFCWFDSKPIEDGFELYLCGYVEPIVADPDINSTGGDNSTGIAAQMIGPLIEWWFAGFDGGSGLMVGVESVYSSYILCEPHSDYSHLFTKCTQNMFLTKRIIECLLKNPDSDYEDLVRSLEDNQDFSEELLLQFADFIVQQIESFDSTAEEDETRLCETPAIQSLIQLSSGSNQKTVPKSRGKPLAHIRPIARIDARRAVNSDTLTCSTSLVKEFFDSVFRDVIECETNSKHSSNESKVKSNNSLSKLSPNESNIRTNWIGNSVYEDKYARTVYYSEVKVNQKTYSLGEFAVFRENDNKLRFGRIMFMFSTSDKQKLCHIHYFCYGNETILAETAPDLLVFMSNDCTVIEVDRIVDKINICLSDDIDWTLKKSNSDRYYCNKLYVRKSGRFEDLPKEVFDKELKCINCLINDRKESQRTPELDEQITNGSENSNLNSYKKLIHKNQTYFVGDCVLLSETVFDSLYYNYDNCDQRTVTTGDEEECDQRLYPERYRKAFTDYVKGFNNDLQKTLNIGFISEIHKQSDEPNEETKLVVNVFFRPQNVFQSYEDFRYCDLNLLFWSNEQIVVGIDSIRGVCKVIYSSESPETDVYIQTNLFYFNQCYNCVNKTFFEPNIDTIEKFSLKQSDERIASIDSRIKLNVLDLFAGCGGLSYGFDRLGLVSKLWAIDKDGSALKSLRTNFESAQVFQEDVNHLLDLLLKGVKCDKSGQTLPQKGDIDLVLGGPPCQGFSGMNRFSSRQYSLFKNSLVVCFLSFVDYFRPKYLLFENVRNFSLFKSSMILKITLSCLIRMGYQCQFAVLQAGSYGLPQTRRRTVILGASAGHPLPHFPRPTHVFSRRQCQLSVNIDDKKYLAFSTKSSAQFRAITVDDAISDLPELAEDYACDTVRQYRHSSHTTHYQKIMRKNCVNNCLNDHYCKELSELCRLRIKNIPFGLASDWRDLPNTGHTLSDGTVVQELQYLFEDVKNGNSKSGAFRGVCLCASGLECTGSQCRQENTLIPWCLVHTANRQYQWSGLYGRLVLNGYFPTTVTNPEPISKQGRVLHPNQNRIISIRESARSQGFPDGFLFSGTVIDKYRQIGNAVPIPLSIALAKQFCSALEL